MGHLTVGENLTDCVCPCFPDEETPGLYGFLHVIVHSAKGFKESASECASPPTPLPFLPLPPQPHLCTQSGALSPRTCTLHRASLRYRPGSVWDIWERESLRERVQAAADLNNSAGKKDPGILKKVRERPQSGRVLSVASASCSATHKCDIAGQVCAEAAAAVSVYECARERVRVALSCCENCALDSWCLGTLSALLHNQQLKYQTSRREPETQEKRFLQLP